MKFHLLSTSSADLLPCTMLCRISGRSHTTKTQLHYITYKVLRAAFSALTLLAGQQEGHSACKKTEWWGAGMVICLEQGADLHMAQLIPLPLTVSCFSKIQIGLPFWYRLTRVVPEKGPLNGRVCVYLQNLYSTTIRNRPRVPQQNVNHQQCC